MPLIPKHFNKEYKVKTWLKDRIKSFDSKHGVTNNTLKPYTTESKNFNTYYCDKELNDQVYLDIIEHGINKNEYLNKLSEYVEKYDDGKILIPPNTNGYHVNHLFKKMVDIANDNELDINEKIVDVKLLNKNDRESFINYCYEKSNK